MKKLLHERLREWADSTEGDKYPSTKMLYATIESDHAPLGADDERKAFHLLANEIEKYYIPRPRFEDGEPVQFGEEFADCSGNPHTLHEIRYRDKAAAGLGAKCLLEANTTSPKDYDGISFNLYDGTFVKRPEPKVLDADGVPCKKGETVWYAPAYATKDNAGPWKVLEVQGCDSVLIGRGYLPGEDDYMETVSGEAPDILTHREPDSLEKLRDDIDMYVRNGWNISQPKAEEFASRLTAIMERDA